VELYRLEEVMSGTEESYLWVTLGFSSELEKHDVLHIVCAMSVDDQDRRGGMADLYLERFDQAYSCYGGAEAVRVGNASLEVQLNSKGLKALDFHGGVAFEVPVGVAGYPDAVAILRRMSTLECGKSVRVDVAG
jgi:immunity protein 10 of polymorphic toxin system